MTISPTSPAAARRAATAFLALLAATPAAGAGQQALSLEHVTTFPESFGLITTVRPLPDGRVLLADPLGRQLVAADFDTGEMEPLGREGRGPGEWRQPDAVYPLPGDSSLLVDLGNTRLTIIDPEGRLGESYSMVVDNGPGPGGLEVINPGGVDAMGRVYYQARGMIRPGAEPDSSRIKRWVPGQDESVVIGALTPPAFAMASSGGRNDQRVEIRPIPLAPQDAWAVAPDGSVAVARSEPYRVEWIRPDGERVRGPEVENRPVPVRDAEKERYLDERDASGIRMEMTVENGVRALGMQRGGQGSPDRARAAEIRALEWPETLPAIRPGGAVVAPDGRLWVRRFVAVGEPERYDVFDRAGRPVSAVRLPAGRRVVGFDGDRVFAVRVDDLGLNGLEVYR